MRVTIHDVARSAQVSINTVSRVLNARPDVKETTRAHVWAVIGQLGYRPNHLARALVRRESRTLGLVITDCTNPNSARQVRVIQQTVRAQGYALMIFDTQENVEVEQSALQVLDEYAVEGVILTPAATVAAALTPFVQRLPVVLLNREVPGLGGCDTVVNDNATGTADAVRHLIAMGHTRIAYITARWAISTVRDRLHGFRATLAAAGIPVHEEMMVAADVSIAAAAAATRALLPHKPTAILAYNDLMAVGVLSAVLDAGLRVPEDIALVGYDDIAYAPYLRVPLTTVVQPTDALATAAAHLLLQRIAGATDPPRRIVLAPQLQLRASSHGRRGAVA